MGGRPDDLDAAFVRLVIGAGARKRRQERVVDVDDPILVARDELSGEDLHVAGQHDDVDVVGLEEVDDGGLLLRLGVDGDGEVVVRDPVGRGDGLELGVIGDDQRDRAAKLAHLVACEKIVHAVTLRADEEGDLRTVIGEPQRPAHSEALGNGSESRCDLLTRQREAVELPLDPLQECALLLVGVLVGVDDVPVVLVEERRDRRDEALLVRA